MAVTVWVWSSWLEDTDDVSIVVWQAQMASSTILDGNVAQFGAVA